MSKTLFHGKPSVVHDDMDAHTASYAEKEQTENNQLKQDPRQPPPVPRVNESRDSD